MSTSVSGGLRVSLPNKDTSEVVGIPFGDPETVDQDTGLPQGAKRTKY